MLVEIGMDLYSCQTCKDFSGNIYVSDNDYLKKKKYWGMFPVCALRGYCSRHWNATGYNQ